MTSQAEQTFAEFAGVTPEVIEKVITQTEAAHAAEGKEAEPLVIGPVETQPQAEIKLPFIPPTTQVKQDRSTVPALIANERGVLIGGSLEEQYRLAKAYAASGLMPKGLNTPEKVLVALQICRELGLPPMTSIGKIMVVNGTPSLFGDLPLALVRQSGKLGGFKETWDKKENGELLGATCWAKRKDTGEEVSRSFTVEEAKKAKLWTKDIWLSYSARMLQMRARGWALKDLFSDILLGMSIAEYDFNATEVDGKIVGEGVGESLADKLNGYLEEKKKPAQEPEVIK